MNTATISQTVKPHVLFGAMIVVAFIACYYDVLVWMYGRYTGADSNYSHGFLIPFISAFFVWRKKDELDGEDISVCWWGLPLVALALVLHLLGTVLYIFAISGFSIFFLVLGTCLFVFGKNITRKLLFPIVFLLFMFPMPMAVIELISFPMKMLVAHTGADIVKLTGIPVLREGFMISIPAGEVFVGNPCSGLRSLVAFLALGAVFAHLGNISIAKKVLLFFAAIPVAIISNVFRIPLLIFIGHFWGVDAVQPESIWHTGTGLFVFVLALFLMYIAAKALRWK